MKQVKVTKAQKVKQGVPYTRSSYARKRQGDDDINTYAAKISAPGKLDAEDKDNA